MDARIRLGAGFTSLASEEIHSDSPVSTAPLSAEQVYHDYAPRVYNTARRMVQNDTDAEDVTQDVLLQVVRKLPTFRGDSTFPTWLHRVTVNAALTHRRRQAVRDDYAVLLEDDPITEDRGLLRPDDQMQGNETRQLIDQAIARLPAAYRNVFVLAEVEGLPNAVIAERLEMSLSAVKSRLHRARAMLREALAPHFSEVAT